MFKVKGKLTLSFILTLSKLGEVMSIVNRFKVQLRILGSFTTFMPLAALTFFKQPLHWYWFSPSNNSSWRYWAKHSSKDELKTFSNSFLMVSAKSYTLTSLLDSYPQSLHLIPDVRSPSYKSEIIPLYGVSSKLISMASNSTLQNSCTSF